MSGDASPSPPLEERVGERRPFSAANLNFSHLLTHYRFFLKIFSNQIHPSRVIPLEHPWIKSHAPPIAIPPKPLLRPGRAIDVACQTRERPSCLCRSHAALAETHSGFVRPNDR